jgi:hypothetical protein
MSKATEMASAMTDQWERLDAQFFAIRASIFGAVLPAINSVVGSMVTGLSVVTDWVTEFPLLGEILGYVALAGLSLGGVVAGLSLALGIGQMMSAGWALTMGTLGSVLKMLRIQTILMTASTWLFNAALWANPITWVVAGMTALIAVIGAAIYYWDEIKATFGDTAVFQFLADTIDWVIDKLNMIPGIDIDFNVGNVPSSPEIDLATQAQIAEIPAGTGLSPSFASHDDEFNTIVATYKQPQHQTQLPNNMVHNATTINKQQGGNVKQYGDIHITTQQALTPDQLAEWDELNVG